MKPAPLEKKEKLVAFSISVPTELHKRIEAEAERTRWSKSKVVIYYLAQGLAATVGERK